MVPHPSDNGSDPIQDESLPAGSDAPGTTPVNQPIVAQPVARQQDAPQPADADKTEVEIDRIEAYLRGPTAFTA